MAAAIARRWLAPEVVQTSAMDCGPASLKCLLEGFRIPVSYGRLREACQTDVDGTSIDTMEDVANLLGLEAEQVMVPADHVLGPEGDLLPAIVVVRLSGQVTHFLVAWRRHGPLVQVMDPATGRRWPTRAEFLRELYIHAMPVPASDWRDWAASDDALKVLRARMVALGASPGMAAGLGAKALEDPGWESLARLDASTRMVQSIVRSGGLPRGESAARVVARMAVPGGDDTLIPEPYWSVRPAPGSGAEPEVVMRGAVLVHVRGPRAGSREERPPSEESLPPELAAALAEPPARPGRELVTLLRADGLLAPGVLAGAALLAAGGVVLEALLFRGLLDIGRDLGTTSARLGAIAALLVFLSAMLLIEFPFAAGLLRMGRKLEVRLRTAFLSKIPRLADRYFRSRLTSDMAERGHRTHEIRQLPHLGGLLVRRTFELMLTTAGIVWLDPAVVPLALLSAIVAIGLPLLAQGPLVERDLRVRNHAAALSRFYLDALLGLIPIRAHGAQRAMRREHEGLLVEWARAGYGMQRAVIAVEAVQATAGFGLAAWILFAHLQRSGEASSVLLLVYWALNIPVLGEEIALIARQYPAHRNVTLRLLEPLGALEDADALEKTGPSAAAEASPRRPGAALSFEGVAVRAAGHTILEGIDLEIPSGQHVAIVGPSGAGKSSLVGLLLGWHRPAAGRVRVDGETLEGQSLERVRRETAWIDPTVQLWNRSLLDNLGYGAPEVSATSLAAAVEEADLRGVLENLPEGLQTYLGEGGALVSGGEGQRVRLGRALLRSGVRLAILDEPFRGLDRSRRHELLARSRRRWREATLFCVTHDVGETLEFERVLVVEGGRVVEDSEPGALAEKPGSRYRALLDAEAATRSGMWSNGAWRRMRLESGRLEDMPTGATS